MTYLGQHKVVNLSYFLVKVQLVEFDTWFRVVNNSCRSLVLDYVNAADPTKIITLSHFELAFIDHIEIRFEMSMERSSIKSVFKIDWQYYCICLVGQIKCQRELQNKGHIWHQKQRLCGRSNLLILQVTI